MVYILLSALLLISCDKWMGINITSKSQLSRLQEKIKDYIPPDAHTYEIDFYYADQRSPNIMGSVTIFYTDPKKADLQKKVMIDLAENISEWKILEDEAVNEMNGKTVKKDSGEYISGISIMEYDFSVIPAIIDKAINIMKSKDMKYAGTKEFTVLFEDNSVQPVYQFTLNGQPEGSPITTKGRYAGIYYHEVYFVISKKGDWDVKVDEELKVKRGGF
jgi:hypothetical protein